MSDVFYVRAYSKQGESIVYDEVKACSVRDTAMEYRDIYAASQSLKGKALYGLACSMLNYGAAAQEALGYNTAYPANAGLNAAEKEINTDREFTDISGIDATGATLDGVGFYGASLLLEELPRLRVLVDTGALDVAGLSLQMASDSGFNSVIASYPLAGRPVYTGNVRSVLTVGIPAAYLYDTFYFRVTDGVNHSAILTYSVTSYASHLPNGYTADGTALHAMFNFTDAANSYLSAASIPVTGTAITASDLLAAIRDGSLKNTTYTVTDISPVLFTDADSGKSYDLKGATVITEGGFRMMLAENVTLSNFTLSMENGAATAIALLDGSNITLNAVTVNGAYRYGVYASETDDLMISNLTASGSAQAGVYFAESCSEIYLVDATVQMESGYALYDASGAYVEDCTLTTESQDAVYVAGDATELRGNEIGAGILANGATNLLISENTVTGAVTLTDCDNASVLLNSASGISAADSRHVYVVSNTVSGTLTLQNNDYLIADANTGAVNASANKNHNGDNVTDVDARLEVGADTSLLPHVDKDLFVGAKRGSTVRTKTGEHIPVVSYIQNASKNGGNIILAPGVYETDNRVYIDAVSNVYVYGFGAMLERASSLNSILAVHNSNTVEFHGLTIGYRQQSCGQVYVLDKIGDNKLLVVTGAGMMNEFGNTNTVYYDVTGMGAQREGTFYAYCDTGFNSIYKRDDGLMEMEVSSSVYNMILEGDILTCRSINGGTTVPISSSQNILFKDMVVYGSAAGFAFVENDNRTATTYYRVADTTRSGVIIDQATFDRYTALESTYGVDLEFYTDGLGRLRGSLPHIGSIDATHTTRCAEGSQAISCLFENMCDDGTNQNHTHARVHDVIDNGDDTTTIVYKGMYSVYSYGQYSSGAGGYCYPFSVGDRVYVYTAAGQLVCDTEALSVTEQVMDGGEHKYVLNEERYNRCREKNPSTTEESCYTYFYSVTVKTADVNMAALAGYDMTLNTSADVNKVMIDNMSMASNGFLFDNTVVRNIRSRGLLIKASDAAITNCTFENIGMGAVAILYEIYWGESGVTENLEVSRNLFRHTGYFTQYTTGNTDRYSPIGIEGLGSSSDEDYLLYKNIRITDNVIEERTSLYAIYVNSAKEITITGNTFGQRYNYDGTVDSNYDEGLIHILGANGVTVSGNTYPAGTDIIVVKENALNVTGTDIENGYVYAPDRFAEHLPTVSGSEVSYHGNWTLGYSSKSQAPGSSNYTIYTKLSSAGWINETAAENIWGGKGGFYMNNSYRNAAQTNYNTVIRYLAPSATKVKISLSSFTAPADTAGPGDGYFAIFKNGTMIWPTAGGSATDGSDWYTITKSTTKAELDAALKSLDAVSLNEGDAIYFCAKHKDSWSGFATMPILICEE